MKAKPLEIHPILPKAGAGIDGHAENTRKRHLHAGGSGTNGARSALREATREVHERLHRHPGFAALLDGTLTRSRYRELLMRLHGFHRPLEDALLSAPRPWWFGLDPEPRRRADRLSDDLRALGVAPGEFAAPFCEAIPKISSAAELLGSLYVREGATLGGRVLARKLDHICGPADRGRSFFAGTARDATLWAELCAVLERVTDLQQIEAMIRAATATFAGLGDWLDADWDPACRRSCTGEKSGAKR